MADIAALNSKFSIPNVVKFEPGEGGLTRAVIAAPSADAHVYLHGAHVTHFQPRGHEPLLFLSRRSHFSHDKAIRGGVPLIFPWFGSRAGDPSAPQHGFARTLPWDVRETNRTGSSVTIALGLRPSDVTRRWLANDFDLVYTISVGNTLELSLEVCNRSSTPLTFEEALHTYLKVGDVRQVSIEGLAARTYLDKTAAMQRKTQPTGPMRIEAETDRVYLDTSDTVSVSDPSLRRRISVVKQGSGATVVWNPWIAKAKAMSDFGDDEWPQMLCVETANAAENAVALSPGKTYVMTATIGVSSFG